MPEPKSKKSQAHKRTERQREQDLQELAVLWREGKTEFQMVDWIALNRSYRLSRSQVHYDLVDLKKQWRENFTTKIDERMARQLATIDVQENEAWAAWRKSIGEVREIHQEKAEGGKGKAAANKSKAVVKTTISHGDPRYMQIIAQCIEARNRLLGLTKQAVQLSGPEGGPIEIEGMTGDFDMEAIDKFLQSKYASRKLNESEPKARTADDG